MKRSRPGCRWPTTRTRVADGSLTPTGRVVNNLGVDLPTVMRDVSMQQGVPLLDLTARSHALLEQLGPDSSWQLHLPDVNDVAHFSEYGATVMARPVADEMVRTGLPAARFLRPTDYTINGQGRDTS